LTIEQYCRRRFLRKQKHERIEFTNDDYLILSEYPVISINNEQVTMNNGELIDPKFYRVVPDCGSNMNFPYSIEFLPAFRMFRCSSINVVYWAGYVTKEQRKGNKEQRIRGGVVPADLQAACLELASWNMNRYRGRRIGMTGNVKGAGIQGEHFEMSIPEQVRLLLEPYKRRVI